MLNLATSCVSPSVLCLPSSFWQHWLFAPSPCNKRSVAEALSPRRRTAQVDKRVGPPPALGRTGPQCLQCVTCVSQRLFHADDHITSVPHKQGGGKTCPSPPVVRPTGRSLPSSRFHYVSPSISGPKPHTPFSLSVVEK